MSAPSSIAVEQAAECAALVLRRPPLNVMNIAMLREMNAALRTLRRHPTAKVLLIKAEGKVFSAGVDVADHTAENVGTMMREFHELFRLIQEMEIPVIAVVDGAALGGGCELAVFCDMIVASERATFGQPEIKVGVFPPVAAVIYPRLIGRNRALEWLLNGKAMTAREAEAAGLVNRVFPVDGFDRHVAAFVATFTSQSRVILAMAKRALDTGLRGSVMEALAEAERIYLEETMKTEDANEGLRAFLEKRQPAWKNR